MSSLMKVFTGIVLLAVAAAAGAVYFFFLRPLALPVFHSDQRPSEQGQFSASTLSYGGILYISDMSELPLRMAASRVSWLDQIGRTDDGMEVYAIPGQDSTNYIMLTTLMFPPVIFRSMSLPPVRLAADQFEELQLFENLGAASPLQASREPALIAEVVDHLLARREVISSREMSSYRVVHLVPVGLPGIFYSVDAYGDPDGNVYLSEVSAPGDWVRAGPLFSEWFQTSIAK